jgi:hypothetical protein
MITKIELNKLLKEMLKTTEPKRKELNELMGFLQPNE